MIILSLGSTESDCDINELCYNQVAYNRHMSGLMGKPTMWFPNRSDINRPVQSQKRARTSKL